MQKNKYIVINFVLKPSVEPLDKFAENLKFIVEPAQVTMLILGNNSSETQIVSRLELMLPGGAQENEPDDKIHHMSFFHESYGVITRILKYILDNANISHNSTSITFTDTSISSRIMHDIHSNGRNMFTSMLYVGKMLDANIMKIYDDVLDKEAWMRWCADADKDTYDAIINNVTILNEKYKEMEDDKN